MTEISLTKISSNIFFSNNPDHINFININPEFGATLSHKIKLAGIFAKTPKTNKTFSTLVVYQFIVLDNWLNNISPNNIFYFLKFVEKNWFFRL